MRPASADFAQPPIKPYFYGYWADAALTSGAWTNLPIVTTPVLKGGMVLSGGGCRVPVAGLYYIGARCRADMSTAIANYGQLEIDLNGTGTSLADTIENSASVGSYYYPYEEHALWVPRPLNAGDVITCRFWSQQAAGTCYGASGPNGGLRVLYDSPLA